AGTPSSEFGCLRKPALSQTSPAPQRAARRSVWPLATVRLHRRFVGHGAQWSTTFESSLLSRTHLPGAVRRFAAVQAVYRTVIPLYPPGGPCATCGTVSGPFGSPCRPTNRVASRARSAADSPRSAAARASRMPGVVVPAALVQTLVQTTGAGDVSCML